MLLTIHHDTYYTFSEPVFIEPHEARLRPREDVWQRLREWELTVEPAPAGRADSAGPDGAPQTTLWFDGRHAALRLVMRAVVETRLDNPFNFLFHPPGTRALPMHYDPALARALAPAMVDARGLSAPLGGHAPAPPAAGGFRAAPPAPPPRDPVIVLARDLAREAGGETLEFLMTLTRRLHGAISHIIRPDGPPRPAAETLARREGACRDTAVLFMAVARAQGMAARFVSGYYYPAGMAADAKDGKDKMIEMNEEESEIIWDGGGAPQGEKSATASLALQDNPELHAWAEVYLPGAGWRGFDPTSGLACAERHVALAASSEPALASPVTGTFRGTATAALSSNLRITEI